jgi:hypothetical protein
MPWRTWGSVALSLCTTAHPLYTRFIYIFGASINFSSENVTEPQANLWQRPMTVAISGATTATQYVLSSEDPGADVASLNGKSSPGRHCHSILLLTVIGQVIP